ncbi:hypothetical protein PsAD5_02152 [Pseudovibrio sp. Ad5]|uniref:hypothetical protein n=1 Tax=Pseudovibrio sp. Ad5 TaxID=989436 RepID=UPI0007AE8217|nr:hypothetical protein [Pseudovibrio sp. Ad5]KZK97913.1 hypothetical protein PsAD5_02152 [Pseudovibrio sp. Ad5]
MAVYGVIQNRFKQISEVIFIRKTISLLFFTVGSFWLVWFFVSAIDFAAFEATGYFFAFTLSWFAARWVWPEPTHFWQIVYKGALACIAGTAFLTAGFYWDGGISMDLENLTNAMKGIMKEAEKVTLFVWLCIGGGLVSLWLFYKK